ncbi:MULTISPECIES: dienelactone hydrolase family protein [Flavobacteriaceae]|uniref:dienelactone hydrolase family protein n=1 Tax=Flavobacteriaceae TaxID=49546 RepID=UPI0014919C51|nr:MULTISPECIES: dienelactone hydrolase family protein [Allomuricauda]MDC6367052.1 dienelactone hydrolase family protein [Muricauda sp. AC10]
MIRTEEFIYSDAQQNYQGIVAFDDSFEDKRPVVLISHSYGGQGKFDEDKAVALANLGYLAFAIDVYGQGRRASNTSEAEALMNEMLADRQELLNRLLLALDKIKKHELANTDKIGAIGFCFGGKCVLDLARSGIEIGGVVSFHGIFDPPGLNHKGDIKAKVLVLHGWEDPLALPKDINLLGQELTQRNAVWEMDIYGHTGHAFTNPKAKAPNQGMMFNALANDRSWRRMVNFFEEVFAN